MTREDPVRAGGAATRVISTSFHGVLDYAVGLLLIASPWLFGFAVGGAAMWVPVILGAGVILYSLITRYELGIVPLIPMPLHLWFDGFGGVLLVVSPWLFGFSPVVWIPHVVIGAVEIGTAMLTRKQPRPIERGRVDERRLRERQAEHAIPRREPVVDRR